MDQHHPYDVVAWIDGAKAPTEESQVVFDVVVRRRLTRFVEVADAVADELLTRDRRRAGRDARSTEGMRGWYLVTARRLLQAQNGTVWRITPPTAADPPGAAAPLAWRRPLGLYVGLGGFLAAFQHVVQRHVFQGRGVDLTSGLIVAGYVAVGVLGVRWFRAPGEARPQR